MTPYIFYIVFAAVGSQGTGDLGAVVPDKEICQAMATVLANSPIIIIDGNRVVVESSKCMPADPVKGEIVPKKSNKPKEL